MKVVLILGGRGLRPGWITQAFDELGVSEGDVELTLVTWHPPAHPLPVAEHWVVGPSTRGPVRRHEVSAPVPHLALGPVNEAPAAETATPATDEQGSAPVPAVDDGPDASLVSADEAPSPSAVESPDGTDDAEQDAPGPPTLATPASRPLAPIYTPARIRAAAGWRLRRIRRKVRMFYRGARGRGTLPGRLLYRLRHLPRVQRLRADRVATEFAVVLTRDARIREAARDAVVVVGVDGNSHRAAWLLARRVPGPEVVIGLPSARRVVQSHLK